MNDDRAQAYTVEGIIGAILVASALVLGLQAVEISSVGGESTEEKTESLRVQVEDMLDAASDRGALRTAVTCIDGDGDGTPVPAVARSGPSDAERTDLGTLLNRTLVQNDFRYEVYVDYPSPDGTTVESERVSASRDVTRASVSVSREVTLADTDKILRFDPDEGQCVPTIDTEDTFGDRYGSGDVYVEDQNNASELYAVVKVRVVAW